METRFVYKKEHTGLPGDIELKTKFSVKVFDYDHSFKTATDFNERAIFNILLHDAFREEHGTHRDILFCKEVGECNRFIRIYDWFVVVASLYRWLQGPGTNRTSLAQLELDMEQLLPARIENLQCPSGRRPKGCLKYTSTNQISWQSFIVYKRLF